VIVRHSPLKPPAWAGKPEVEDQAGWPVVVRFEPEPADPQAGLADLSHRPKGLLAGPGLADHPKLRPGQAIWTGQALVCGINPEEAAVLDLRSPVGTGLSGPFLTDLTEAWTLMALFGPLALEVLRRLLDLDLERPDQAKPWHAAAPAAEVPAQVVALPGQGFLLACGRAFAASLYEALLHSGRPLGLRPVGQAACDRWWSSLPLGG
jgi:hypothetical protein